LRPKARITRATFVRRAGQERPVREIDAIGNHLDTGRRQTHDPTPVTSGTIEAQPALEDER
jgi:hypothetical protein